MKKVVFWSICIGSILLLSLTGCSQQQSNNIQNKLDSELEYVEDLIFKIANKHAKGEYIEDDKINWEGIKGDANQLNDVWNTLVLDLTEGKVSSQDMIDFSNELNLFLLAVSEKDDSTMLDHLKNMYDKVIVFKQTYSQDKNQIEKNKIKGEVLGIYDLANKQDYTGAKTKATNTVETYKNLMNDISYAEENSYNLNKIYILLEELNASIPTENQDLIRMKYITTVENL